MASIFSRDSVIEKTVSLALGCCVAGGLFTVGAGAAPVVGAAIGLGAIFTSEGLRRLFKDQPECEAALKRIKAEVSKGLIQGGEVDEATAKEAINAFDAALRPEQVFTADALRDALANEAQVVAALTRHVLADMARHDPRFGPGGGLARDLAEQVLSQAFTHSVIACPPFAGRANLVIAEITLDEVRSLSEQMAEGFDRASQERRDMEARQKAEGDANTAAILAAISQAGLAKAQAVGLSEPQLRALLVAFAHEDVPLDQAEAMLLQSAKELVALRARLSAFSNDDPGIAALLQAAADAIDAAELDRADNLLQQAEDADLAEGQRRLERAARTMAQRGELARSQAAWIEAANHFGRAADLISPTDTEQAWSWRFTQAASLNDHGKIFPGPSQADAARIWRDLCLPHTPRATRPADWAMTQNNLGNALSTLGERAGGEAGVRALNDAVQAYRSALEVYTQTDMPAQWATTQNNLGNALRTLGERAGGEAGVRALNDAVQAYRSALEVRTQTDMPAQWATTQNNLGNALQTLGQRAGGEAGGGALNDAVQACRSALEVYTQTDMPAQWAGTQNNLGNALQTLGERAGGEAGVRALNDAVQAFRSALEVHTRTDMPAQWAGTQNNLGNALSTLGQRAGGEAGVRALKDAVQAYRSALEVYTQTDMPAQWATTQNNLGIALSTLGQRAGGEAGVRALNDAVQAYRSALEVYTQTDMPAQWAMTQNNLGNALKNLGQRAGGEAGMSALKDAVQAYRSALEVRTRTDMPAQWAMTTANLAIAQDAMSRLTDDPVPACAAAETMVEVIAEFQAMQADAWVEQALGIRAMLIETCRDLGGTCSD